MRLLCAAALALTFGLWVAYADDKKSASRAEREARLAELKKKYEATLKELNERLEKATRNEKPGIYTEMREEATLVVGKAIKVAEVDPKDDIGFEASAFVVKTAADAGAKGEDVEKAADFLAEHHAADAKVKELLVPAMKLGSAAGARLLKAASEKNPDRDTKATALFIRGFQIAQGVEYEEDDKKVPALVRTATELLETAAKMAPDVPVGKTTISKGAAAQLEELKAISALFIGRPAPNVTSKSLDGKKVALEDYKGKVVLLDAWATWCGPCKAMIPHERALVRKMKERPFALISVSADEEKKTLQAFLNKNEMPWVHWWDNGPESEVLTTYRVQSFPTLYLIDHAGIIRNKWTIAPEDDVLDAAVEELVKIAEKSKR